MSPPSRPLLLENLPADCVDVVNRVIAIPSRFFIKGRALRIITYHNLKRKINTLICKKLSR